MRLKLEKLAALGLIPAIILAEALLAFWAITGSGAVEDALTRALGDLVDGECRIERFSVEPLGGIEIGELEVIADPDNPPLLWARGVAARFTAERLLSGIFLPEEITVDDAGIWIPSEPPFETGEASGGAGSSLLEASRDFTVRIRSGIAEMEGIAHAIDEIRLEVRFGGDGTIVGSVTGTMAGGTVRASGSRKPVDEVPVYQFRLEGDRIDCREDIASIFELIHAADEYKAFAPRGEVSFVFESDPTSTLPVTGRLWLFPHGAAMTYLGWPDRRTGAYDESFLYPVENLNGTIAVVVPGEVNIDAVRGTINKGRISANGFVRDAPAGTERRLVFDIRNTAIDEPIIAALAPHDPLIADVLRDLALEGSADIMLTLLSSFGSTLPEDVGNTVPEDVGNTVPEDVGNTVPEDVGNTVPEDTDKSGFFEASVLLRDAAICPEFFPLPVEGIRGRIDVKKGKVVFNDLEGRYGDATLTGRGEADRERISLNLKARNVMVDAGLVDALRHVSEEAARLVESIHLSGGRLALEIELESIGPDRDPESAGDRQMVIAIHISAQDCVARPDFFPLHVEDLGCDLFVHIDGPDLWSVVVDNLTATHEGSRIGATARIEKMDLVDLDILCRNQTVTPQLLAALAEAVPPSSEWIGGLTTEGTVDCDVTWREGGMTLDFHPRFNRVESPLLPCVLEGLVGTVRWRPSSKTVLVESLSVGVGGGRFVFDQGEVGFLDRGTSIRLSGSGQGLDLNKGSTQLAPGHVHDMLGRLGLNGIANLTDTRAEIELDGEGSIESLKGSASVSFNGASIDWPVRITDTFGRVALDFELPGPDGGRFGLTGEGSYLGFVLEKREFSSVRTRFLIDESGLRLTSLDGNLYGGRVMGDRDTFTMSFDSPCPFSGRLKVRGADLNRLLGRAGYALKDIAGKLNYRLRFEGELENINRMTAEGRMSVEDGHLWRLPVFSTLWGPVVNIFGVGKPPTFDTGSTDFTLKDGILNLENARLNSSLMTLQGSGAFTVDSANVEVQFSVGPTLPIIGDVIAPLTGLIKQGFFNLRVSGDYDNMHVSYDSILTSPFRNDEIIDRARCPAPEKAILPERF